MRKGCETFLALILDSKRGQVYVEKIPLVREFPYAFPEELPDIPLEREVDLSIEIVLGKPLCLGHHIGWLQWS